MRRRTRRLAWAVAVAFALISLFTPPFQEAIFFIEALYWGGRIFLNQDFNTDFHHDNNIDVFRRPGRTSEYDITLTTRSNAEAPDDEAETETLVTIDSSFLITELWWIGKNRLKLAFVVDPRAKIGPTVGRVGRFRIDYMFVRGYEPPHWPLLLIRHRP